MMSEQLSNEIMIKENTVWVVDGRAQETKDNKNGKGRKSNISTLNNSNTNSKGWGDKPVRVNIFVILEITKYTFSNFRNA
jgi:hypothetical protein